MAGRKPVPLGLNKKHFTKLELVRREEGEKRFKSGTDGIRAPTWLDAVAKKEFRRLAKELVALDIICNIDIGGLAIACDAYSKYIMATTAITEKTIDAQVQLTDGVKTVKKNPLGAAEKYARIYREYCSEYGLTPAARIKISVNFAKKDEPESPMAAFLKKRAESNDRQGAGS